MYHLILFFINAFCLGVNLAHLHAGYFWGMTNKWRNWIIVISLFQGLALWILGYQILYQV